MLILFWVIVVLVGILLTRNARYALRQYVADKNRLILSLYLIFSLILALLVIRVTTRVIGLVQIATEDNSSGRAGAGSVQD